MAQANKGTTGFSPDGKQMGSQTLPPVIKCRKLM